MSKSRGPYRKYTEEDRNEIKRLHEEEGKSTQEISNLLGYPEPTVRYFLYGRRKSVTTIKYPKTLGLGIIQMEVEEPMPRRISGEDLKKENKDLREEVEYLKDKVAYLEALYELSMKEKPCEAQKKRGLQQSAQQSLKKDEKM